MMSRPWRIDCHNPIDCESVLIISDNANAANALICLYLANIFHHLSLRTKPEVWFRSDLLGTNLVIVRLAMVG